MAILALGVLSAAYLIARPGGPFDGQDRSNASSNLVVAQSVAPSSPSPVSPPAESSAPDDGYIEASPEPEEMAEDRPPEDTIIETEPEALPVPNASPSAPPPA